VLRKDSLKGWFGLPTFSFGRIKCGLFEAHEQWKVASKVYPSQTKIWEGGTKEEVRISKEALLKGVSTRFGLRTIEKSVENPDFIFLSILPKFSFGEHKSQHFPGCYSFQNRRLGA
jgi:hypothetical protein